MKKLNSFILLLLPIVFLLICSSCRETQNLEGTGALPERPVNLPTLPVVTPTDPEIFIWSEKNFPRIDGSTATIPLGQAVAATLLGKSRAESEVYAEFTGTNNAYLKLSRGETDLLIVYEGSEETINEVGDDFETMPIGRDALVFLVNAKNPVNNLSTKDVQDIYRGRIINWNKLGGNNQEIRAFQRNETSGSQTMMKKLVMEDLEMEEPAKDLVIGQMDELTSTIATYNNGLPAIGYNVYYYVTNMKNLDGVKLLSIDGIKPSSETIGSGEYPFVNDFFVVIRKSEPENSPARRLFNWMCGEEAKTLMEEEGYVPIK